MSFALSSVMDTSRGRRRELYGIEVEVENAGRFWDESLSVPTGWRITEDGSLRNRGAEFVLREPMTWRESAHALNALYIQGNRSGWSITPRTSMHIHINFAESDSDRLLSFLAMYMMLEPGLFTLAGSLRRHNYYCVPLWNLHQTVIPLIAALSAGDASSSRHICRTWNKYTALNLRCLHTQGSVEVRLAPTFSQHSDAHRWLSIIHHMSTCSNSRGFLSMMLDVANTDPDSSGTWREILVGDNSRILPEEWERAWEAIQEQDTIADFLTLFGMGAAGTPSLSPEDRYTDRISAPRPPRSEQTTHQLDASMFINNTIEQGGVPARPRWVSAGRRGGRTMNSAQEIYGRYLPPEEGTNTSEE